MKIAIDMSLSKYVQSDLCSRNATDWGKCFNNNELDQLEQVFEELQGDEIVDTTLLYNKVATH